MLVQLRVQLEESTKGRFLSLQAILKLREELAPVAGHRNAESARSAPRRRKRNVLLHRRHDSHRVSPSNWRNRQKDAFCPCRRFRSCAEELTNSMVQIAKAPTN